jgi:transcriptional regulator with XRE-family HTH domain
MKTLRETRIATGKTQLDIQRDIGIFQTKISREENGIRTLTVLEMKAIEKYLGAEIDWVTHSPLTANQHAKLSSAIFVMMRRYGSLETLKFTCRFRTLSEMYDVLCNNSETEQPLGLPDHNSNGGQQ